MTQDISTIDPTARSAATEKRHRSVSDAEAQDGRFRAEFDRAGAGRSDEDAAVPSNEGKGRGADDDERSEPREPTRDPRDEQPAAAAPVDVSDAAPSPALTEASLRALLELGLLTEANARTEDPRQTTPLATTPRGAGVAPPVGDRAPDPTSPPRGPIGSSPAVGSDDPAAGAGRTRETVSSADAARTNDPTRANETARTNEPARNADAARNPDARPTDAEVRTFDQAREQSVARLAESLGGSSLERSPLLRPTDTTGRAATAEQRSQEVAQDRGEARRAGADERAAAPAARSSDGRDPSPRDGDAPKTPLHTPSTANSGRPPASGDRVGTESTSAAREVTSTSPTTAAPADATPARTAPVSTAPASTVTTSAPLEVILRQIRQQVRAGVRDLQIRLDPPELGRLNLRFVLRGESLHVTVRASSSDVVAALKNDLAAFEQTLRDAGVDLSSLDIDLEQQRDPRSADTAAERRDASRDAAEQDPDDPATDARSEERPEHPEPRPTPRDDARIDVTA